MEKIKILLIDHEEDFKKKLSERIKSRVLELDVAVNREQALELVVNVKPDVMILNPKTAGNDCMELLWEVKTTFPDIQVIILSRHYSIQNRMEALVAGAYRLFKEPVDIDDLINTIIQAYKERSINNYISSK
ncbi:MAG: response regulator [Desulfobacterales bacterium]